MRTLRAFAVFLLVLSVGLGMIHAQDTAGITGVVTDSAGAVVPDATVTLTNAGTATVYTAKTNSVGSYTINGATPGPNYTETVEAAGFQKTVISNIYLNVGVIRTQNVKLPVGAQSVTVEVSAANEGVTLNTTDSSVGNNFEVQFLQELPIQDRSSPSVLFTQQPGITGGGAVTGAREDQDNVTLDGLDVNDNETGAFGAIVANAPVDSVQEFRGTTANPLSSAGEGGGGQFNLVTRSGTNHFHGGVAEYHRDTDLEANNWFNNNATPIVPRPPLVRNQFGGNVGGPILKDKVFFFFDWDSRRDTLSNLVERTVPLTPFRNGTVAYNNNSGSISVLSPTQVAGLDPQGKGFDPALLSVITSRYPVANDLSGSAGDLVNTAGFRFDAPFPLTLNVYVGKLDYNLTDKMKLYGRVTFSRENATQSAIQFPGDPETYPFFDKSFAWVVGHDWTIGTNKLNQASFGIVKENYSFPNTFNPNGITQYSFGGIPSGGTFLSAPYASAINAQARTYPVPQLRDDFSWQKGKHNLTMGGTFKYINPDNQTILDYNSPTVGLGGNTPNLSVQSGQTSLRPADLGSGSTIQARYDSEYAFALGRYASVGSTFNYNAAGNLVPQGTGSIADYKFYESEVYFGDTWKVTPSLTLSYGLRWQNYTVPYEKHGIESVPTIDFNQFFGARLAQSAAGVSGAASLPGGSTPVPYVNYVLGGKANHGPDYFGPTNHNFAPRFAFAWTPTSDRKTVFSGGGGIIYDHTVVSSIQYQLAQFSYLFQASATHPNGVSGNPIQSLLTDPRFSGFANPPAPPTAPGAIKPPYAPFIASDGTPFGLENGGAFNETVDKNLKTPYSITYDFGFQHEFPQGLLLHMTYVGRLGRRLLAQADANQLIDFPDAKSGQTMGQAFAQIEQQLRGNGNVTAQPWFENVITPGTGAEFGYANNTQLVAYGFAPLPYRGDFADTVQGLSTLNEYIPGVFPYNVGMGSQFSEDTYYTNKGFSSYNGLLATLHKNAGHGLQFDLNYTWSHSIDNVSVIANAPAIGGYGFICDVVRPRECRSNSDFDITNIITGNFLYELPFGRGRAIGTQTSFLLNELIGGWELSGLPTFQTGGPFFAGSTAFVAGYANDAPAILTGSIGQLNSDVHKSQGSLLGFKDPNVAVAQFTGPVGFAIGSRNNLRGPKFVNMDLGLGKDFAIYADQVKLRFRADAFNAFNHPSFNNPSNDITQSSGPFGVISSTSSAARVLQLSLRLEF